VLGRVGVCALVSASVGEGEEMLDGLLKFPTLGGIVFTRIHCLSSALTSNRRAAEGFIFALIAVRIP